MAQPQGQDAGPPLINRLDPYTFITERISSIVLRRHAPLLWFAGFGIGVILAGALAHATLILLLRGIGVWGLSRPVAWGFAITNFVWWIGIGHAGTLISAFLLLMNQSWRQSINRLAEAMTIVALGCASLFPLLHLGRPGFAYWLLPYPNTMGLWPQVRSPLIWDFVAVITYFIVSLLFWYLGMVPDLATLRDRTDSHAMRVIYGVLALGWRGDHHHWERYEKVYRLLAGLATPLVVSVHSVVSFDFAVGNLPGWHSTIDPPYFVAGAMFSGLAMVITIIVPLRAAFGLHDFINERHLDNLAKVMLTAGLIVAYGYMCEIFLGWYSGNAFERYHQIDRAGGMYAAGFAMMIAFNVMLPQALWIRSVRRNSVLLFAIALLINAGMWAERFMVVVQSLSRDYLPSSWGVFIPTFWDWATFAGSIGLFIALYFLFIRFLPLVSMLEVRKLVHEEGAAE